MAQAIVVFVLWPQPSACPENPTSVFGELVLSKIGGSYGLETIYGLETCTPDELIPELRTDLRV